MDIENSVNKEYKNIQNDGKSNDAMEDSKDERNMDVLLEKCKGAKKPETAKIITEDDLDTLALKLALMSMFLD